MSLRRQENLIYLGIWTLLFALPLTRFLREGGTDTVIIWHQIMDSWEVTLSFLVLFLLHNFVALPFLRNKRKTLYVAVTACLLGIFMGYAFIAREFRDRDEHGGPRIEAGAPPMRPEMRPPSLPQDSGTRPLEPGQSSQDSGKRKHKPPIRPLSPVLSYLILAVLTIGTNLAIHLLFYSLESDRKLKELEQEKLNSQLEALRYQINPHFFMNTLNNIHALVDIDPELAKDSIVRFSKLMRYVLYYGEKAVIPFEKEIRFLSGYVELMSLRCKDSVKISFACPKEEETIGVEIPPFLFISYVENAFKHGVTYDKDSFIDVRIALAGERLNFDCTNSRHEESDSADGPGGVGIPNSEKRIRLIYGKEGNLKISMKEETYSVHIDIPVRLPSQAKETLQTT